MPAQSLDFRPPTKCTKCGEPLSRADWDALPVLGHSEIPETPGCPAYRLEYRNHACGTTLCRELPLTRDDKQAEERRAIVDAMHAFARAWAGVQR